MSHLGVDVVDFLLIAVYPVVGIFVIEMISRVIKFPRWIKLVIQGFVSLGFAIAYVTLISAHRTVSQRRRAAHGDRQRPHREPGHRRALRPGARRRPWPRARRIRLSNSLRRSVDGR